MRRTPSGNHISRHIETWGLMVLSTFGLGLVAYPVLAAPPSSIAVADIPAIAGVWTLNGYRSTMVPASKRIPQTLEGGPPPLLPWAEALYQKRVTDSDRGQPFAGTTSHCLPGGIPLIMTAANYPIQILVTPDQVTMLFEENSIRRMIYLNAKHPINLDPSYLGHSIGRFEGDTLVVDTVGLRDETTIDLTGMPHTDALHVVERIRRIDAQTLEDHITLDDPKTFSRPWSIRTTYKAYDGHLMEYYCAENQRNAPTADNKLTFK